MATSSDKCPLNEEHCQIIDATLVQLAALSRLIEQCEKCGLDVAEAKAMADHLTRTGTALKSTFFPDRP